MSNCIKRAGVRLWTDESGASLLEYSVLIGLITVAVVSTLLGVSNWMTNKWTSLQNTLGN
jgi:pilus assembly protein Flp/PilA